MDGGRAPIETRRRADLRAGGGRPLGGAREDRELSQPTADVACTLGDRSTRTTSGNGAERMSHRPVDLENPPENAAGARKVRPGRMPVAIYVSGATIEAIGDQVDVARTGRHGGRHSLEDQCPGQEARDQHASDPPRPERELIHCAYGTPGGEAESRSGSRRTGESLFYVAESQHGPQLDPRVAQPPPRTKRSAQARRAGDLGGAKLSGRDSRLAAVTDSRIIVTRSSRNSARAETSDRCVICSPPAISMDRRSVAR